MIGANGGAIATSVKENEDRNISVSHQNTGAATGSSHYH